MEDVVTDKEHIENDIEKAEASNNEAEGNKEVPKRNMRDCIYGNIDVSVKTMDKVIMVLLIALAASFIFGIIV